MAYIIKNEHYTEEDLYEMIQFYKRHHITLNSDHLYSIMLTMDLDTLKSMCATNQQAYKICKNIHFWQEKFSHDGLHVVNGYSMNEYPKVLNAATTADKLVKTLIHEEKMIKYPQVYIYITEDYHYLKDIFPEINIVPYIQEIRINISFSTQNSSVSYEIIFGSSNESDSDTIEYQSLSVNIIDLKIVLIKILYYYSNVGIWDDDDYSYLLKDLNDQVALFYEEDGKTERRLKERLKFLKSLS